MNPTAAYGFLAHGIIFGAVITLLPLGDKRRMLGLAAIPVALVSGIASFMHGIAGIPSLTLLVLALWQLAGSRPSPLTDRPALLLVAFAIPFYAMVLGLGSLDPYQIGYQPLPLLAAIIPLAALLWWRRLDGWLLILTLDLAGYASGIFANLWDALFDPLLVLVALAVVIRQHLSRKAAHDD
ncbi:MAG: hypothetical protein WCA83_02050 [Azonexus sp.]